jgi:hypothetical protein
MVELLKLFMAKPMAAVVSALCIVTLSIHLGLTEVKLANATLAQQNEQDQRVNEQVYQMNEVLIRIDENLKVVKQKQTDAYLIWNKINADKARREYLANK